MVTEQTGSEAPSASLVPNCEIGIRHMMPVWGDIDQVWIDLSRAQRQHVASFLKSIRDQQKGEAFQEEITDEPYLKIAA